MPLTPAPHPPQQPPAGAGDRPTIGPHGLAIIRRFDPWCPRPYRHWRGYPAIGYGHRLRPSDAQIVTHTQAELLLAEDCHLIGIYLHATTPITLPQRAWDAVCSLLYDVGLRAYEQSRLRAHINDGHHQAAIDEWSRFDDRAYHSSPGGLTRRRRHAEKGLYQSAYHQPEDAA